LSETNWIFGIAFIKEADFSAARVICGNKFDCEPVWNMENRMLPMEEENRGSGHAGSFDQVVMPHLDAAYNLAHWLVRNTHDAEDIVQESYLRAFKFFGGYQGGDPRAWVLKIVRNTSYSFLEKNRPAGLAEEFDEQIHTASTERSDTETALLRLSDSRMLREALAELPVTFREVLVLRELEDLSYKEIAEVMGTPIGTVMSGLARGRAQLRERLLRMRDGKEQRDLRKQ
jgi:RNA polymerase sigma-70 factor (ECF subfamily)